MKTTHEQLIAAKWFTVREIKQALACEFDEAKALCDATDSGRARGGYGMNILNKVHRLESERVAAARNLAHFTVEHCPICGN